MVLECNAIHSLLATNSLDSGTVIEQFREYIASVIWSCRVLNNNVRRIHQVLITELSPTPAEISTITLTLPLLCCKAAPDASQKATNSQSHCNSCF